MSLSQKALTVLRDIAEGRGTHNNCRGQSAHGGRIRILTALRRRGLIDHDWKITKAGKAALENV